MTQLLLHGGKKEKESEYTVRDGGLCVCNQVLKGQACCKLILTGCFIGQQLIFILFDIISM